MITATEEFWDFERASYEDELDAWRERTTAVAAAVEELVSVGVRVTAPRRHAPGSVWRADRRRVAAKPGARRPAPRSSVPARRHTDFSRPQPVTYRP